MEKEKEKEKEKETETEEKNDEIEEKKDDTQNEVIETYLSTTSLNGKGEEADDEEEYEDEYGEESLRSKPSPKDDKASRRESTDSLQKDPKNYSFTEILSSPHSENESDEDEESQIDLKKEEVSKPTKKTSQRKKIKTSIFKVYEGREQINQRNFF